MTTNPSSLVDLTKRATVCLEKKKVPATFVTQVGFAVDVSGSMHGLFHNGTMELILGRIQALANRFDDNATLDMWAFDNSGIELEPATPELFGRYVQRHILSRNDIWGGTDFAPVLEQIQDHYFGALKLPKAAAGLVKSITGFFKKNLDVDVPVPSIAGTDSKLPVYLIMLTDGDNSDEMESAKIIRELGDRNIYIQFIGIGRGSSFRFIKKMAELFNHVGFIDFSNPEAVTDDQMFDSLISDEFVGWIKGQG